MYSWYDKVRETIYEEKEYIMSDFCSVLLECMCQ